MGHDTTQRLPGTAALPGCVAAECVVAECFAFRGLGENAPLGKLEGNCVGVNTSVALHMRGKAFQHASADPWPGTGLQHVPDYKSTAEGFVPLRLLVLTWRGVPILQPPPELRRSAAARIEALRTRVAAKRLRVQRVAAKRLRVQ